MNNNWRGFIHQILTLFLLMVSFVLVSNSPVQAQDVNVKLIAETPTVVQDGEFELTVKIQHPDTSPQESELTGPDSSSDDKNKNSSTNIKDVPLPKNFAHSIELTAGDQVIRSSSSDNRSESIKRLSSGEFFGKTFAISLDQQFDQPQKISAKWKLGGLESKPVTLFYFPKRIGKISFENWGDVYFTFFYKDAPKNVYHFMSLAQKNFYQKKASTFHRLIDDFILQGGDPKGDGTGGRKPSVEPEFHDHKFRKGTLAMAHGSKSNQSGTQFFFSLSRQEFLDQTYTAIGQLKDDSKAVLDKIQRNVETDHQKGGRCGIDHLDKPKSEIKMKGVEFISEKQYQKKKQQQSSESQTKSQNSSSEQSEKSTE